MSISASRGIVLYSLSENFRGKLLPIIHQKRDETPRIIDRMDYERRPPDRNGLESGGLTEWTDAHVCIGESRRQPIER